MAKFTDLASELVLAITSHIPRSADKLHLILVSHQMHNLLKIPQLYKHIVLDQEEHPSKRANFIRLHPESEWDTVRLRHLTSVLKDSPLSSKLVVESLDLKLDADTLHQSFGCSELMLYLHSLKSLSLSSNRSAGHRRDQKPSLVSPHVIGRRLRNVSNSLESLTIDINQDIEFRDGSGIGLRHFIALKHLSIQSHILLGEPLDLNGRVFDDTGKSDWPILAGTLPPGLQKLQIGCRADGYGEDAHGWTRIVAILLEDLMKWGLDSLPELQDITVYNPVENLSPIDMDDEQGLYNNESECEKYVVKGLWGELVTELTELALKENRNVVVRYEQGSEKGSRF